MGGPNQRKDFHLEEGTGLRFTNTQTVCPRILDHFYIAKYNIEMNKTSWTFSKLLGCPYR